MTSSLHNKRILVTRPAHQAGQQSDILASLGATVVQLPLLDIKPYNETDNEYPLIKTKILDLDLYSTVIFISPNAARIGCDWIDQYWPQLPISINWVAIGKATAAHLADYGITAIHSDQGYDSESLLSTPLLTNVDDQRILIMRGHGGRETLAETLTNRGAKTEYADLYQRQCPNYSAESIHDAFALPFDAILVTSGEALSNLHLIASDYLPVLQQQRLIVPSDRIASLAEQKNWQRVTVASGPDDHAMIQTLTV